MCVCVFKCPLAPVGTRKVKAREDVIRSAETRKLILKKSRW